MIRFQAQDIDAADGVILKSGFFIDFMIKFSEDENDKCNDVFEIIEYF
jgi:hypothetical protein